MTSTTEHDEHDQAPQTATDGEGTATVTRDGSCLSPDEFFREFTARPDVDRIMTALAQIDQDERTEEQRNRAGPRPARARRWPKSNPS
jgi:hypothetical protein